MCCIFTCCAWMIDLVQRVWTFTMSCCIMSAVVGVMTTSSMAGIALGYNYSLAEYIDLKETNVSVYLKRGVFDDEVADDLEWRRAGHLPVAGHIADNNLRTGAPEDDETTTIRSGRRLDDSMVEGEDQNKFEGSLMRLTAKPVYQDTAKPEVTEDHEMASALTRHPEGSLDQLKAIQSLIDSRRMMGTGGTTNSPLAAYASVQALLPYLPMNNNPNVPMDRENVYRRMMTPGQVGLQHSLSPEAMEQRLSPINPARLAVPDPALLISKFNWMAPKYPNRFLDAERMPDFQMSTPTYPTPIRVYSEVIRPQPTTTSVPYHENVVTFALNTDYFRKHLTTAAVASPLVQEPIGKLPDLYSEQISGDFPGKGYDIKMPNIRGKPTEEEYEDEIKGLPVRKRRSIKNPSESNIFHPVSDERSRNDGTLNSPKHIFTNTIQNTSNRKDGDNGNNFTTDKNQTAIEEITDTQVAIQISHKNNINQRVNIYNKVKSDLVNEVEIIRKLDLNENKKDKPWFDRLVALIETKKASLEADTTTKANIVSTKNNRIKRRRESFESKIVSSKYEPNNVDKRFLVKKQSLSNQEILNSVSINFNDAGLLQNPASSTLVKLLKSFLTA